MTAPSAVDVSDVDLTDVDLFTRGEHPALFAILRAQSPVHENVAPGGSRFFALTKYADVLTAYRDHEVFGSTRGAILGGSFDSAEDTAAGRMLVASDLPRHRLLKQRIQPSLSAAVVARVRARVAKLVDQALDRARADGGCDFAASIATELPAGALMEVMGLDHAQAHELIRLTRAMVGFRDESLVDLTGPERLRLAATHADIFDFLSDLVAERRRAPGDDLISALLGAEINGRPLAVEEVLYNAMNVAVGGNETSSYTACHGLLALMENPDQYDLLRASPAVIDTAVEEMLRFSSVNAYVQRVVRRDVEVRGVPIRAGESVTLWNFSANRDEEQFPQPDRFDVTRTPNKHLSYGSGLHRCVGAPVAQAELSLLFQRVIESNVRFRPAGRARRLRSNFILGITSLPVEIA